MRDALHFLADERAFRLRLFCEGALVGIGVGIEKGFMPGGKNLRAMGVKLSSLAVVAGIEDGQIILADD